MGSVYASLLGKAGHEVWAIDTWQEHVDAIAGSGLRVSGASGSFVVDNLHVGAAPADAGLSGVVNTVMPLGAHVVYDVVLATGHALKVSEPRDAATELRKAGTAVSLWPTSPAVCRVFQSN